jgi:hypothetical protein
MHKEMKNKRERMAKLNVRRSFSIAVVAGSDAAAANLLQSRREKEGRRGFEKRKASD